jgi:hypothetical protein
MAITSRKITTYADNIVDLADRPNEDGISADQLKAIFDGRGDKEIKDSINGIVDDLVATTDGASGADQIGSTALKVGGAETVQSQLEETLANVEAHKANTTNPHVVTKLQVGLGNADDTSDINKPVSTAHQAALNLKADLASPTFTGVPKAPTAITGDNSDQIATNKFVLANMASAGLADMSKTMYDPNSKLSDAFNTDNHSGGLTNTVFTIADKQKLDTPAISDAVDIVYDNVASGLTSIEVQGAVDELSERTQEACIVTVSTDDVQAVNGQIITLTNVSEATTKTYTLGVGETSHTFRVVQNQTYKISVDTKADYFAPNGDTEFIASPGNVRAVSRQYVKVKRYGFKRARATTDPNTKITYLYDAVGLTPAYTNLTTNAFEAGGWGTIINELTRPVMKKTAGVIDYELSRSDFTKKVDGITGSDVANTSYAGDCFIEFRKYIWVYRYNDATYDYVIFCNGKYDTNYKSYATTDKDGIVRDSFLYGAFGGSNISSKLRSLGTGGYLVSQTRNVEVSYAEANGSYYDTIYKSAWDFICDWLTLIGKTDDGQGKFGKGRADTTSASACGTTKDKPMFYGGGNNINVKIFGIEDFYGNVWQGMRGMILDGANGIKTKMVPPYNFDGAGYVATGVKPSGTTGGYVSVAVVDDNGYVPSVASGSQSTHFCDGLWYNNGIVAYAMVGGSWDYAFLVGPRSVILNVLASDTNAYFGSRLSFVGPGL